MDRNLEAWLPRLVGVLYLVLTFVGSFPLYVRSKLFVPDDPVGTVQNILESELLYRLGMLSELGVGLVWGSIAFCLFLLLRPLQAGVSALFLLMVAIGVATLHTNVAHLSTLIDLVLHVGADTEQAVAILMSLFQRGERVWALWAGLWLIPLGIALGRTRLVPPVFTIGLPIGSLGYILPISLFYLAPDWSESIRWLVVPAGLIELSFGLWLLARGVDEERYVAAASEARRQPAIGS